MAWNDDEYEASDPAAVSRLGGIFSKVVGSVIGAVWISALIVTGRLTGVLVERSEAGNIGRA